ncbi:hypothetical protein [Paenibacillus sp. y28]|uniref:hypothetical protein n=1 Tax=Paenibacillus sp. y28 TaxID=3129110 RepID=UPI00301ACB71
MNPSFMEAQLRRCNRNFVIANLLLFVFVLGISFFYQRALFNYWFGPFEIRSEELVAIKDTYEQHKINVRFEPDEVYEAVASQVHWLEDSFARMKSKEETDYDFSYIKVNDKFIIVRTLPDEAVPVPLTGTIFPLKVAVLAEVLKGAGKLDQGGDFLPFFIDTTHSLDSNVQVLLWIQGITGALLLFNLARLIFRVTNPERHPVYKKLALFGDSEQSAEEIDQEWAVLPEHARKGHILMTSTWIVRKTIFSLKFSRNRHDDDTRFSLKI